MTSLSQKEANKKHPDLESFHLLKSKLPEFNKFKSIYKDGDFKGSFATNVIDQFHYELESFFDDPTNHFVSSELQNVIQEIKNLSTSFMKLICLKTFPTPHNPSKQTIRRLKFGDIEDDFKTGEKLNEIASHIFENYSAFLRLVKELPSKNLKEKKKKKNFKEEFIKKAAPLLKKNPRLTVPEVKERQWYKDFVKQFKKKPADKTLGDYMREARKNAGVKYSE